MWVGGGLDREVWFRHRFVPGQMVEGAIRDDNGRAQGTVLVRVTSHESTSTRGHVFQATYITASDSHYRWWMTNGEGKKFLKNGWYHSCEGNATDCAEVKSRVTLIHMEKFRIIGPKEWAAKTPDWAFKGSCRKDVEQYNDQVTKDKGKQSDVVPLPWVEAAADEDDLDESSSGSDQSEEDTAEKIKKLKARLARLEKKGKGESKKPRRSKRSPSGGRAMKKTEAKKKRKKSSDSPSRHESPGSATGKKKRAKKEKKDAAKRKKKRQPSESEDAPVKKKKKKKLQETSSSSEEGAKLRLFTPGPKDDQDDLGPPKKGDRGPFGAGQPVAFDSEGSSESDEDQVFREAPVQSSRSGQQALVLYSHRKPGRLAARLLLKMQSEVALGSTGAAADPKDRTPATATHYFLTIMAPQLGSKMNLRTQRELRTLMVAVDHLARKAPAKAADVLCQRIKALERATAEGHWNTAQFLELIPSEMSTLLERDEQAFVTKEYLQDMKVKNYERPRPGTGLGGRKGDKGQGKGRGDQGGGKGKNKKKSDEA